MATSWHDGRVQPLSGIQLSTDGGTNWVYPLTSWPASALEGTANDNTPPGWSCANVRDEPTTVAVGIVMITYQARVPDDAGPGEVLTNTTGVASANFDPDPSDNNATDTFALPACTIDFRASGAGIDILGTAGADVICGSAFADRIFAGAGNDVVFGGAGNDEIFGVTGNDSLYGGTGNDKIAGGAGDDRLFGNDGTDQLAGNDGADRGEGGPGTDARATETKFTCES